MVSGVCGENEEPRSRPRGRNLSHSLHSWRRCLDSSPVQCSREAIAGRMPVQTLNGRNRHRQTVRTRSRFRDFFPSIARTATMSPPKHARYQRGSVAREKRGTQTREAQPWRGEFRDAQTACGARHSRAKRTYRRARPLARDRSGRLDPRAEHAGAEGGRIPPGAARVSAAAGELFGKNQRNGRSDVGHVQGELPASSQGSRR